jgi:periplasmic protein TonB
MASQSRTRTEELAIPAVLTIAVHVLLAVGLVIAGGFADHRPPPPKPEDEVDIEPPPRPRPLPLVALPVVPLPEPKPPPPPLEVPRVPPPVRAAAHPPTAAPPPEPPPITSAPPAGNPDAPAEGNPITLPDVYVGTPPRPAGAGGTRPPAPVSVASIKKRALPIGDVDYVSLRDYPEAARKLSISGEVKVRLIVDEHGNVTDRTLVKKLGHGLDELAMSLAAKLRFEPAVDSEDREVRSVVVWSFEFVAPEQ